MLFGKKGELVRLSLPRYFQWRNFADCFKNDSNTKITYQSELSRWYEYGRIVICDSTVWDCVKWLFRTSF